MIPRELKLREFQKRLVESNDDANNHYTYSYIDAHVVYDENPDYIIIKNLPLNNVNLQGLDLTNICFSSVNMNKVNLSGANLTGSIFDTVHMNEVNLSDANLTASVFLSSTLNHIIAKKSSFFMSTFRECAIAFLSDDRSSFDASRFTNSCVEITSFYFSSMTGVHMSCTSFDECCFYDVNFENMHLDTSKILHSTLRRCNFTDADISQVCPETGAFIGWKKCIMTDSSGLIDGHISDVIVQLLIPETALRSSAFGRKCRASEATVLDIQTLGGVSIVDPKKVVSFHDRSFTYEVGKTVTPSEPFNPDWWDECGSGIHFFMSRSEAVNY